MRIQPQYNESAFYKFMDEILSEERVNSEIIYHYSSAGGMLGLLKDRALQASSISMLNDSGELRHGIDILSNVWKSKLGLGRKSEVLARWMSLAKNQLSTRQIPEAYIACGSLSGDLQPLFLLYGSYAVGFSPQSELTKEIGDGSEDVNLAPEFRFGWRKVVYQKSEKVRLGEKLFDKLTLLSESENVHDDDIKCDLCNFVLDCMFQCAIYMKDSSSMHESEVRLYSRPKRAGAKIDFRISNFGITPFVKVVYMGEKKGKNLTLLHFPISEIRLGPGLLDPQSAKVGLETALEALGYSTPGKRVVVQIDPSTRR